MKINILSKLDYLDGLGTPEERDLYRRLDAIDAELVIAACRIFANNQRARRKTRRDHAIQRITQVLAWTLVAGVVLVIVWCFIILMWGGFGQ